MAYESNIRGSKGRPINPARAAGVTRIRDSMRGYEDEIPLKDRVRARNLDAQRGREAMGQGSSSGGWRASVGPGVTQPATGSLLSDRRALHAQMEKAGPDGITQEMRQRGRALGVTDDAFNAAVDRIRTNANFTPGSWKGAVAQPLPGVQSAPVASPAPSPAIQGPPKPRINKATGMLVGADPRDPSSGYNPRWAVGTAYQQDSNASPAITSNPAQIQSDVAAVKDIQRLTGEVGASLAKFAPSAVMTQRDWRTSPQALQPIGEQVDRPKPVTPAAPAAPSSFESLTAPRQKANPVVAAPTVPKQPSSQPKSQPSPGEVWKTSPQSPSAPVLTTREAQMADYRARDAARRRQVQAAKAQRNANKGIPEWAQSPNTNSIIKKGLGRAIQALQHEW